MSNLSWNDIRNRALAFSNEWADASRENADAKPFWVSFFNIFGLSPKRVASFEEPVKKLGAKLEEHYITETNILKAIRPLFLDAFEAELATCKTLNGA